MILLIDNYDSFVYNLDRYLQRLGHETVVLRNDQISASEVMEARYDAIVISPGPQTPDEAGACLSVLQQSSSETPILGVCLGHQAIGQAFGGLVVRCPRPMHGRSSRIHHVARDLFQEIPNPMEVARYHSLMVDRSTLPTCLEVLAETDDGIVMSLRHRNRPIWGVQFHPESILTEHGFDLLANFLKMSGLSVPSVLPAPDCTIDRTTRVVPEPLVWWEQS